MQSANHVDQDPFSSKPVQWTMLQNIFSYFNIYFFTFNTNSTTNRYTFRQSLILEIVSKVAVQNMKEVLMVTVLICITKPSDWNVQIHELILYLNSRKL
jgi:hypothetical protein